MHMDIAASLQNFARVFPNNAYLKLVIYSLVDTLIGHQSRIIEQA